MRIYYERDDGGYQIGIYPPTDKYPMFQVTCNDEDFFCGTRVFRTAEEVSEQLHFFLSRVYIWKVDCDMRFTNTDRTLMEMLFQRGTASDISGYCKVGRFQRIWSVRKMPKTEMHEAYYSGTIGGIYDKMAIADTLHECLNRLEEIIKEYS